MPSQSLCLDDPKDVGGGSCYARPGRFDLPGSPSEEKVKAVCLHILRIPCSRFLWPLKYRPPLLHFSWGAVPDACLEASCQEMLPSRAVSNKHVCRDLDRSMVMVNWLLPGSPTRLMGTLIATSPQVGNLRTTSRCGLLISRTPRRV